MTLIKFKPGSRELLRDSMIPNHFLSAFDSIFNDSLGKFERHSFFSPRVDVVENEKTFDINMALPGLKKEDVSIEVNEDVLTVSGEHKMKNENKDAKYHTVENHYGKFSRSFTLPGNVDKDNIQAELTDGVLKLSITKAELKEKTKVAIK